MNQALLIIDIQNDYFTEGSNPLVGATEAANQTKTILDYSRSNNIPVFFVQHFNSETGTFFRPNTHGAEIHSLLTPKENETVIQKNYPNSFKNTSLLEHLNNLKIEQLVVCGMMSHMCIDATVRAAKDFDFDCVVLNDCCATKDLTVNTVNVPANDVHNSFMAALNGYYATVKPSADFLAGN